MGDHSVVDVHNLVKPKIVELKTTDENSRLTVLRPSVSSPSFHCKDEENNMAANEEDPLIQTPECRICQEEDQIDNLEVPCACSGSLKYAHRTCVQRWCNEKGDIICEICHESYKPGYTSPPRVIQEETTIDISGGWTIRGTPLDMHDPRVLAMAAAQRHILQAEYDEYAATNASGAAFFRSAVVILMALLLLRHALIMTNGDEHEDTSTVFSLFLLRGAGFLLPCYIIAWAVSILQRRRQRQEETTEVAFILQTEQGRGLHFTIAPDSPATPQHEPHDEESASFVRREDMAEE